MIVVSRVRYLKNSVFSRGFTLYRQDTERVNSCKVYDMTDVSLLYM